MIKCPVCDELIGPSAPVYKCSRGFVDLDGVFIDDSSIIFHKECSDLKEPYGELEEDIKNN